ncbi:MAG: hypothetical protein OEY01_05605 [Desulfobulbaceae bacterium]|nr:hypothetical protein [Desulfobulbaceae bacterium]
MFAQPVEKNRKGRQAHQPRPFIMKSFLFFSSGCTNHTFTFTASAAGRPGQKAVFKTAIQTGYRYQPVTVKHP